MGTIDISELLQALGLGAGYSAIGLGAIVLGYFMWDLLTPSHHLGTAIHGAYHEEALTGDTSANYKDAPSWNAALLLASGWLGNALIAAWSIFNTESGVTGAVTYAVAFSLLGLILQGLAFVLVDLLTPGRLNEIVCQPGLHPYSAAVVALNVGVALIVMASITP